MKNKRGLITESISQLAVLLFLGAGLIWLFRQRSVLAGFAYAGQVRLVLLVFLLLYLFLLFSAVTALLSNYFLQRYDPGDNASVRALGLVKRYHLNASQKRSLLNNPNAMEMAMRWLQSRGFKEVSRRTVGVIYERPASAPWQRLLGKRERYFLLYRPMLNVLIEDRLLVEAAQFIEERAQVPCRHNVMLLLTDMENDAEVLSSAAGVVNYLCRLHEGFLVPLLLDMRWGRLFYPQDYSLLALQDKWFYAQERRQLLQSPLLQRSRLAPAQRSQSPAAAPALKRAAAEEQRLAELKQQVKTQQGLGGQERGQLRPQPATAAQAPGQLQPQPPVVQTRPQPRQASRVEEAKAARDRANASREGI